VPLLFAVTLFASASLLFMVQPMVGKMVLPLLGGSPAVWNACMVFFQALLLLGYLYAHKLSSIESPRKQWTIHTLVLILPLTAFALAVAFSTRGAPIAVAESLAPTDERSPILSVLAILTVAIGVPFFVVSTTATLLQKWFVHTGHPAARDPYFLYAASNVGSLISLLGYPLVVEPRMPIAGQAWLFAAGFGLLAVLIFLCGRAAANPIGVPPDRGGAKFNRGEGPAAAAPAEPPPALARKLKWVALAFVPSTLMLGVTFEMTTDIASIPLLWVGPLALYLLTFIIAFGRVPDWFRVVIGNLAPVMVLLLVFVMIGLKPHGKVQVWLELLLYNLTFFAAALMCHYELARDRPSPRHLTEFFLLMSVGGVLGGVFNSLVAPLAFGHAYEFRIALVLACFMVPKLTDAGDDAAGGPPDPRRRQVALALDLVVPVLVGVAFYFMTTRLPQREWFQSTCEGIGTRIRMPAETVQIILLYAVPVMVCFFFVDRPVRFALCVAALVGPPTYRSASEGLVHSERSFFGILKITEDEYPNPIRSKRFRLTDESIQGLRPSVPAAALAKLSPLADRWVVSERAFLGELADALGKDDAEKYLDAVAGQAVREDVYLRHPEGAVDGKGEPVGGKLMVAGRVLYRKLVHGTTLHGTQVGEQDRDFRDDFMMIVPNLTPWDAVATFGAIQAYDGRQEPLTYYHRTGPVGAMLAELRSRKGGAEANAHFAMVGLGTGSVSCYARPGQRLTFYEIDPAVKRLVADTDRYFTYVSDARKRGAALDFRMGDARLKLKQNTDDRYALLLVDAFSSDSIPVHLLTVEAVQLYLDRMTDDGILALHISNKFVRLEPVVAAIAAKLGLTARVWNDDADKRPGKTASSWVVLARKPEHLGALYQPAGDLIFGPPAAPGAEDKMRLRMENQLYQGLLVEFDELHATTDRRPKYKEMNEAAPDKVKGLWLEWVAGRLAKEADPFLRARLELYQDLIARHGPFATFGEVMVKDHGHAFRRLETREQVPAWTDDFSDVLRVMGGEIAGIQKVREFFGLPTPIKE
jgi:hypothetical protein